MQTEQDLPTAAQTVVLEGVFVVAVVGIAEGEQGGAAGEHDGDPRDGVAEAEPAEVHRHPGRQPQPGQDGGRGEGRDAATQVSSLVSD